jgi:hypothetical protein
MDNIKPFSGSVLRSNLGRFLIDILNLKALILIGSHIDYDVHYRIDPIIDTIRELDGILRERDEIYENTKDISNSSVLLDPEVDHREPLDGIILNIVTQLHAEVRAKNVSLVESLQTTLENRVDLVFDSSPG